MWEPGHRILTAGLVLMITLVAAEALAVATILPLVERDLGDIHLYGWVFSAFFLGSLVGIVAAGRAADRLHPARPLAVGLVLFAAGLALASAAPSMLVLVAARALQGFGAGAIPTTAYVCIGRGYAPRARPRMFALLSTAWVVPSLLGPGLAGVVGEAIGWRWVFSGLLPLLVVIAVLVVAAVRRLPAVGQEASGAEVGRPSVLGAVQVAAGASLLLAGLGADRWWQAAGLVALGLAIGLPAFVRLTPPGTLGVRRGLPAAVALRGVLTFSFFAADAYVPLTLATERGLPAAVAGLALTGAALTWTAGAWIQERRVHRVGPRRLVRSGFALVGLVSAAFAVVLWPAVPPALGVVVWAGAGLGMGLAYAPLSVTVLGTAPPGREGAAASGLQLADTLGVALGTGTGGALVALGVAAGWASWVGLACVFALAAVVGAVGLALSGRLPAVIDGAEEPGVGPALRAG